MGNQTFFCSLVLGVIMITKVILGQMMRNLTVVYTPGCLLFLDVYSFFMLSDGIQIIEAILIIIITINTILELKWGS